METEEIKNQVGSVRPPIQNDGPDDSVEVWKNVPVEIWTKIFQFVQYTGNKEAATLRGVCSFFRNVIDEHVDFHVVLNHNRLNKLKRIGHVRIKTCTMKDCTMNISSRLLMFNRPNLISRISLSGPILKLNLSRLVDKTPNVETITLSEEFLEMENILGAVDDQNLQPVFWRQLKYLNLIGDKHEVFNDVVYENLQNILQSQMPTLKGICVIFKYDLVDVSQLLASFLARNPNVKNVETWPHSFKSSANPGQLEDLPLGQIQLHSFKLKICELHSYHSSIWKGILNNQKTLVNLAIEDCTDCCRLENCFYFEQLTGILESNKSTLTCLSLHLGHLPEPLNAKIFQKFTKLKMLALNFTNLHDHEPWIPKDVLVGLKNLPDCIEKLEISGLDFDDPELLELAKNSHMKQLKYLKLGLNVLTEVRPKIFECFLRKQCLVKLSVGPMNFTRFQEKFVGNKKYLLVGSEFMVPLQVEEAFPSVFDVDLISVKRIV